ncbi:MAG: cytochrome c family protein [Alphaproteobacteria bacterium]|nr:cytochrome c, membrane-bound [Hyphomonas sp.]MBR9806926.1 cytochrome c family protein [Alphaproteobacteria bacterium]
MGELGLNKIFGALLATALGLFALHELSNVVFSHGSEGGHGEEHAEATSMSEQMCAKFAYCVDVADAGGSGGEEEEVFDLGLLLANADVSRGERTFKGQCTTCHTIEAGGANGTGPNLHNVVGAEKAHHAGFNYSAALSGMDGTWTYENLNEWLTNPSSYARGTSMSFAGLRRDADRINVIAYLASNTENPPPFPEPLPAAEEGDDSEAVDAELPEGGIEAMENPTLATGEVETVDSVDGTGVNDGDVGETVTIADDAADAINEEEANSAMESAEDTFEEEAPTLTEEEGE